MALEDIPIALEVDDKNVGAPDASVEIWYY